MTSNPPKDAAGVARRSRPSLTAARADSEQRIATCPTTLAHGQSKAGNQQRLIHAADLAARANGSAGVDLSNAVRRVVPPVAVRVGDAERLVEQHRAGRQLEDVI